MDKSSLIPRDLLGKYFGEDPRLIAAFEDQALAVAETVEIVDGTVGATNRLQDATVVTLSANEVFNNEFLLTPGDGTQLAVTAGKVAINVDQTVARVAQNSARFVPPAHVTLFLPATGTLVSDTAPAILYEKTLNKPSMSGLVNANGDTSAAAAGVPIGGVYRDNTTLKIRVV